jgi:acetyl esterase/lipase
METVTPSLIKIPARAAAWLVFLLASGLFGQAGDGKPTSPTPETLPIWSGAAPGSESWNWQEEEVKGPPRQARNVTRPTLTTFFPESASRNGTAVIVCPGGGFRNLMLDYEGADVARWLASRGITAFVLRYRLVRTGGDSGRPPAESRAKLAEAARAVRPLAMADGQQAVRVVRAHAAEWGIQSDRVGMIGFSAGAMLIHSVALHHDAGSRPDFVGLIYGAEEDNGEIPADAPPLFIAVAGNDATFASRSVSLYSAWKASNHPAELHVYAAGGHGFSFRHKGLPAEHYIDQFADWMEQQGFLKPAR